MLAKGAPGEQKLWKCNKHMGILNRIQLKSSSLSPMEIDGAYSLDE